MREVGGGVQIVEGYVCQRTANGEHQWRPKLVEKPTGWMTNSSCHIVGTMRGCTLGEELARVRQRKVSNEIVTEVHKTLSAKLMLRRWRVRWKSVKLLKRRTW